MRRPALYSRSSRAPQGATLGAAGSGTTTSTAPSAPARQRFGFPSAWRWNPSDPRLLWSVIASLALLLVLSFSLALRPVGRKLTQDDIDAAVLKTLETTVLPSAATAAHENIRPSVVRVMGFGHASSHGKGRKGGKGTDTDAGDLIERGIGSGVVIVDKGIILTNLHVVQGADTIKVMFADGLESTASVINIQPENDLAVLQAHKIPDDLIAATMRSTADLLPGDQVIAVGFPFGIGPSVSAGVVSGLKRAFRSPEGRNELTNLIQFDAAANPGNSGGPLVTMDGEVVGIVTAILNPSQQRTFIGIGFAVPIENAASAVGLHPF
ncbi:MAG: trypsin-like peptidase domain-containing protein [Burkholderiales bacterium]|nr:trypsin-like peptidase domain-containing protein [Burkholderiales bacterium]